MSKKKSKLAGRDIRVSSPFDSSVHKTEWTGAAKIAEWINNIVETQGLSFGMAEVETIQPATKKRADINLFESPQSDKTICVIEFKLPYIDPFTDELKEDAHKKANKRKAKYFATSNFQKLLWFKTEEVNRMAHESEQIAGIYELSRIEDLDNLEEPRFKNSIIKGLEKFIFELSDVQLGKKAEPLLPIDELLIHLLHEKIHRLSKHYREIIRDRFHKEPKFRKKLTKWFIEQHWHFTGQESDFEKAARQTGYLLTNKILFYQVLKSKQTILASLMIPDDLVAGGQLQNILQSYFDTVIQQIDYETIYSTDFIDQIAFPEHKAVVDDIKDIIAILKRYDFSSIGFETIGRIFEKLIPSKERHNLGQYFTNADVVDIILRFCHKKESDKVIDPACGAGTFLVRAYQHKKLMNRTLPHEEILKTLWGIDIAKFPAHLSMINLAINDLGVMKNYPNIAQNDFFDLMADKDGFILPEKWRKVIIKTLGKEEREVTYPRWYDCIVGNPPYTRQEEMSEISGEVGYKKDLITKALYMGTNKIADISKRAGIHAYFFVHGTKFLKDRGMFGFIVSNSWLDVDYGKGLQELFLQNYKIIAIIDSKVERWFEEADINTCIIILEKCKDAKVREENKLRFVYLFKPLRHFIPAAQDIWEKQKERLNAIDDLIKTILFHEDLYQSDDLRIFTISQKDLWEEGYNKEKGAYEGAKWGKYLRAPEIYFKILKKGQGKLVPLRELADVRRGFTTGANKFFYLTEEEIRAKGIEKEYWMHEDEKGNLVPNKVIISPREGKKVILEPDFLNKMVLFISEKKEALKKKNILSHIRHGEREGYNKRPTCSSREKWFGIERREPWPILHPMIHNERQTVLYNKYGVQVDHNLFEIKPKNEEEISGLLGFLLSTVGMLFKEFGGRTNLGQGALKTEGVDIEKFLIPKHFLKEDLNALNKFFQENAAMEINSIFDEVDPEPEKISLEKIKPDRRKLDKIIMGDILGLTEDEQIEVYKAVIDLVRSRLSRAKSVKKKGKVKEGVDIEHITRVIMDKLGKGLYRKFYDEKILSNKELKEVKVFSATKEVAIENSLFGWKIVSGKKAVHCVNEEEARYLKVWIDSGLMEEVKVPTDQKYLQSILPELEKMQARILKVISDHIDSISSQKIRKEILNHLQRKLFE
ncbi:MAG TPA: N-6 DNA methylase [Desulfobacteraceae bacterium]|nr:N-6 DNA methylase [Desulfobacteraceae bacterium]HPJ66147.1 N-6 DNA methylase [Desulfobacteraceae bacterium]HPQ27043.1 N-6 DNA methylase [Desulfobacteraceae bacterium]